MKILTLGWMIITSLLDVSGDDGETWVLAELYQPTANGSNNSWGWCLWTAYVISKPGTRIVSRAGKHKTFFCLPDLKLSHACHA